MSMAQDESGRSPSGPTGWFHKHWFAIGLTIVVVFGYQFGKDLAISHNKLDNPGRSIDEPMENR